MNLDQYKLVDAVNWSFHEARVRRDLRHPVNLWLLLYWHETAVEFILHFGSPY